MEKESDLIVICDNFDHLVDSAVLLGGVIETPDILTGTENDQIEGFHQSLSQCLSVDPELTQHFDRIFKTAGRKIQFVSEKGNAHISETTIILPLCDKEGNPRSKEDLVDALIFESCNADPEVQIQFNLLDEEFKKYDMSLEEYGRQKAGIEAKLTVLRAAKLCDRLVKKGIKIAEQGTKNIEAIREKEPLFFLEEGEPDLQELLTLMCNTQHQAGDDPTDPTLLKSGELYHYEKVKALGETSFIAIILKAMHKQFQSNAITDWFHVCLGLVEEKRKNQPMIFCLIIEDLGKANLGNFSGLAFNGDMIRIAEANAPGQRIPPCPVQTITDLKVANAKDVEIALKLQLQALQELTDLKLGGGISPGKANERKAHAKIDPVRKAIEKAMVIIGFLSKREDSKKRDELVDAMGLVEKAKDLLKDAIAVIVDPLVKEKMQNIFDKL